jgi:hypothetical protein
MPSKPVSSDVYPRIEYGELRGAKTILYGGLSSGKTLLTAQLLQQASEIEERSSIRVVDFAPPRFRVDGREIGGRITDFGSHIDGVGYFVAESVTGPRSMSEDSLGVWSRAWNNYQVCSEQLEGCFQSDGSVLFFNDLSLYLHFGSPTFFLRGMHSFETVVGNTFLSDDQMDDMNSGLTDIEGRKVSVVLHGFDYRIRL